MARWCACTRCGYEVGCGHGSWPDRHPAAAAVIAIPTLWVLIGVMSAHWWLTIPVTIIAAAWWLNRKMAQRAATAARADHDHREIIARAVFKPRRPKPPLRPASAGNNLDRYHPRPADHWSATEPIRSGAQCR